MDSSNTPDGVHPTCHGVYLDSIRSPPGVHQDPWGSVTYSKTEQGNEIESCRFYRATYFVICLHDGVPQKSQFTKSILYTHFPAATPILHHDPSACSPVLADNTSADSELASSSD